MDPRSPYLRLSDAEREEAFSRLGQHFAEGRLDKDEYDERSDAVWSAKTRADLRPIFADLPAAPRPVPVRRGPHLPHLPVMPVVVALVLLTVLTHLPWVLFGLLGFWAWKSWGHGHHGVRYRSGRVRG